MKRLGTAPRCATRSRSSRRDRVDLHQRHRDPARRQACAAQADVTAMRRRAAGRSTPTRTSSSPAACSGPRRPRPQPDGPAADDTRSSRAAAPTSPTSGSTASTRRRTCAAMDAQGIDAVVLYPSVGLFVPYQPELDAAGVGRLRAARYDDWVAQYCATDPSPARRRRHRAARRPRRSRRREARRAAAGSASSAMMARPNHLYGRNLGDRGVRPVLRRARGDRARARGARRARACADRRSAATASTAFALRHACSHPMEQMAAMASLVLDGALERHPDLRVAFLESGTGWVPYWLARLDDHREWMAGSETAALSLSPSEYFARQCVMSTDPEDPLAAMASQQLGADHVVWASDFPHPDARVSRRGDEFLDRLAEPASPTRTSTRCSGTRRCASIASSNGSRAKSSTPREPAVPSRVCSRTILLASGGKARIAAASPRQRLGPTARNG